MRRPQAKGAPQRAAALVALTLASMARAAVPGNQPSPFTLVPLPGRAWAIAAPDGNTGVVAGSSGVLLVDPPAARTTARLLLRRVRELTGHSPRWLVHTRKQASPTAGDRVLARAGAVLVGSGRIVDLGDSRVEISSVTVHPGGDSIVFSSRGDVLFAGDLFEKETVPDLTGADIEAWAITLEGFLARHPASYFVGSLGQPGRALDVRYLRDYVTGLRLAVRQAVARGDSGDPLAERVLAAQRARFGRWTGFDARARRNIEAVERELNAPEKTPR